MNVWLPSEPVLLEEKEKDPEMCISALLLYPSIWGVFKKVLIYDCRVLRVSDHTKHRHK